MEKEVVISIKGVQKYEGTAPDTMELVTKGRLSREGESYTLSYQERAHRPGGHPHHHPGGRRSGYPDAGGRV